MGRIKRAWYYQRKADAAERREQALRNRQPSEKPYAPLENRKEAVYASCLLTKAGSNNSRSSLVFKVKYPEVGGLTAVKLGLFEVSEYKEAPSVRKSAIYPTTVRWYQGTATPTRKRTQWGTSWIQYYENAQGGNQSHYSSPISAKQSHVTPAEQIATFNSIFEGADKQALLGGKNGRAYLIMERLRGYGTSI
ncbi:hypothetical protein QYC27_10540 [Thermosynechococcus sp. PP45]|uniref:hypothetical protein n=1 Tax=unclassified Thermosynechococcus TaxID=2622553 RepID=UPI002672ADAC|nr:MULTISPECIES: hypothetical protein [unclassified Thermosynechococcus]WKT80722.1 hypothetical protein QYC27_10540 [Thermosynechococcus sp. PP45]WNC24333.1 hypothetical protein RHH26_10535 [Thermosynechococcus sp. PP551]WNC26911.1 hypothetical protein RHH27_10530 [Thermosynechococcus sp. PP555]